MPESKKTDNRRVLVAEDQLLISLMIEEELREVGLGVVGPFASCIEASEWLQSDTPDAAILDVDLRDGPCTALAEELTRRGVEFAVFSGNWQEEAPEAFSQARWFAKPSDLRQIIELLMDEKPSAIRTSST